MDIATYQQFYQGDVGIACYSVTSGGGVFSTADTIISIQKNIYYYILCF